MSNWLAGVGGALEGIDREKAQQDLEKYQQQQMALRERLALIASGDRQAVEQGRNDRNANTLTSRESIADANRAARTEAIVGNQNLGYAKIGSNEKIAGQRDTTRRRGQDMTDDRYWGGELPFKYDALDTTDTTRRRGQDLGAATARRGQDMASGDRENAIDATNYRTDETTRARNALGIMRVEANRKPNVFGTGSNPTDWANRYDEIYNHGASADDLGGDLGDPSDPLVAPPPAAAPAMPPAPGPKTSPFPARPQASAPAAPAPVAPPAGLQVGSRVKLKTGQSVTVTKVNPDGTFEYR